VTIPNVTAYVVIDGSRDALRAPMTYDQFAAFRQAKQAERQLHFCPSKSKKRRVAETNVCCICVT